jgi:hypothetical protein
VRLYFRFLTLLLLIGAAVGLACGHATSTREVGSGFEPIVPPWVYQVEGGVVGVSNGGTGSSVGLLPEVTSWAGIPGCVNFWVCDLGLTLGDSGTVFTWSDQVSSAVLTNAVNADQPTKIASWLNGHCGVQFTNQSSTIVLSDSSWTSLGYPYALLAVVEPTTSSPANAAYIINPGTGATGLGMRQAASGLANYCYDGTLVGNSSSMIANVPSLIGCMFPGLNDGGQGQAVDNIMLRGALSENGASVGSRTTVANGLNVGGLGGGTGQGFGGQIGMIGVFNTVLNRQYLTQAMAVAQAYYGNAF